MNNSRRNFLKLGLYTGLGSSLLPTSCASITKSSIPNAGPFHEYKGQSRDVPFECNTSTLKPEDGILHLPKGIGSGVEIDPDFIKKHKVLT